MNRLEAIGQRGADCFPAQVSLRKVRDIIGCSESFVFKVKKMKGEDRGLTGKARSGGHNYIWTGGFLTGVAPKVEAEGFIYMRQMAKELKCSKRTIKRSVCDLAAVPYTRRCRLLLTEAKKSGVRKGRLKISRPAVQVFLGRTRLLSRQ